MKYMYPLKIGSIIITWSSWRTSGSTSMVRIWFLEHSISWSYCTCDLSRKVYFFWQIVTLSKVWMALAPYFGDGVFNQIDYSKNPQKTKATKSSNLKVCWNLWKKVYLQVQLLALVHNVMAHLGGYGVWT